MLNDFLVPHYIALEHCRIAPPILTTSLHIVLFGGWGEASLQGQSTPTGRSFRPVRACVRARSVIHVESGIKCASVPLPFSLLGSGAFYFPFPFRIGQLELV